MSDTDAGIEPLRWAVKFDDATLAFDDLPIRLVQTVADKHGMSWLRLLDAPGVNLEAGADLIAAAAKHLGLEPLTLPVTISEARRFIDRYLHLNASDLPGSWTDENPPEGDQTTG